ncbi:MAG: hypothetical protein JKY56_24215 [Kofleriaceae bacterium]|nr:hypothetical protein [Kofleriaceae bacterium]
MKITTWKQTLGMGIAISMVASSCSAPGSGKQMPIRAHSGGAITATFVQGSIGFAAFESEQVRAAAMTYPQTEMIAEAPLSLTADDGTGLLLESLQAKAVVDGPLAFTELRMRFRNPQNRVLEGRFQITLPDGASVSRLAMKMDNGWREAEVVERMAARRAYEDFLHRKQDPMLLEKEAGNQFRARIFPIPANGVKEIILSFSHELVGGENYTLPLRGLPAIDTLAVSSMVAVHDREGLRYERQEMRALGEVPTKDFSVAGSTLQALRNGTHIVARVRPKLSVESVRPTGMTILFDTSASRAPGFQREVRRLHSLIAEIAQQQGAALPIVVAAFDQEVTPVFRGKAGDFGQDAVNALLARRPLGASDLSAALSWAGQESGSDRLLIVSDGIATSGDMEVAGQAKLLPSKIGRIDMILVGGIRDTEAANRIVRGTRSMDGVVLNSMLSDTEVVRRLGAATTSVEFSVPGAAWVWPTVANGVQPGDEVLIYAGYADQNAPETLSIEMKGAESLRKIPVLEVPGPLLKRSSVQAHIARLQGAYIEAIGKDKKSALKAKIVDMSTKYRVLSDHTALLVLEAETDYARFGIDRKALTDILVVGQNGLSLEQRNTLVMVAAAPRKPKTKAVAKKMNLSRGDDDDDDGADWDDDDDDDDAEWDDDADKNSAEEEKEMMRGGQRDFKSSVVTGGADGAFEFDDDEVSGDRIAPASPPPPPSTTTVARRRRQVRRPQPRPRMEESPVDSVSNAPERNSRVQTIAVEQGLVEFEKQGPPALTGQMASIYAAIEVGNVDQALAASLRWRNEEPGQVMALVALGEALEAAENFPLAARAYGSIIDLFPSRADLRRFAGARLSRLEQAGQKLSVDTLQQAAEQRPDHLSVHRLLAYALVRDQRPADAFAAIEKGLSQKYPSGRFAGGLEILREDLGIIAAAWLAANPKAKSDILARLKKAGASLATKPSTRFVLNWETDANDVDFHIFDGKGGHSFFSTPTLQSGGRLFADVTTGYGPECFAIDGDASAYPYRLQIHYYSRGPMGYGMGQVEILQHDGKGGLKFDDRSFVVMNDGAYVDLGKVLSPL